MLTNMDQLLESVNEGLLLLKSLNITQLCILHFIKTYQKQAYIYFKYSNKQREREKGETETETLELSPN